ncbi:MAG: diguanylate cyclase [Bacillota bacterium]|nr:diguanylate cyclase [Bacillota bacterium]
MSIDGDDEEIICISRDVTKQKQQLMKLEKEKKSLQRTIYTDELTGLGNRRFFNTQLKILYKKYLQHHEIFSLLVIDIDYFKKYNDSYGHQEGDECLILVANTLKGNVRDTDFVCRIGGEEFCIILPNTNKERAISLAEGLCKKVEEMKIGHPNSNASQFVTVSIGGCAIEYSHMDHMNPNEAFFRIKSQEWQLFSELERILEMNWIDEVIKSQLITCYFQPIVNAQGETFAYELLSRFIKEDGSLIYPNKIFEAAKSRGRLYALDRLCRMTAVRHAAILKNTNIKAFINFIPTSIYSPQFCLQSTTQLANEIGQYMKLDMKFVQGVATDLKKQQVAQQFLQKALEIGTKPLAEGVEEKEDFEWLKQSGMEI